MKRKLLVLLLITGSLFAQTFEQRYGLLQVPSIFKRLGTTVSTVGTTDGVNLYTLSLNGQAISTHALAVNGTGYFSGDVNIGAVGTSARLLSVTNTGGDFYFARERSIGTAFASNSLAYAAIFAAAGTYPIQFSVNATVAMTILDGGSTFIGYTADPTSGNKFAVSGNSYFNGTTTSTGAFLAPNGSAASPSYSFTSDPNSGMYSVGADQLGLSVNGSNMVTVTTTGVGIGTTASASRLDVADTNPVLTLTANAGGFSRTSKIDFGATFSATDNSARNAGNISGGLSGTAWDNSYLNFQTKNVFGTLVDAMRITNGGNVGIRTPNPLATFHDNGTAMFGAGTGASLTDSSLVINYTTGSPVLNWYGIDGDTWNLGINTSDHAVFSGATLYSFDNGITLADAGTSANSFALTLTADNATTPQYGSIQVMYGADPYLRISAPNDAGTATAIMDLKDQRIVIGSSAAGVDYDIYMQGETNQGTITYMEDEDRFDVDNDFKVGASLWGSAQMSGTDAFTTTATADTVAVTGATVNDIYILTYITAVTAAEAPLSVTATATGFIATRPAGTTSAASYAWMRQRK